MLPKLSVAFGLPDSFGIDTLGGETFATVGEISVGSAFGNSAVGCFSAGCLLWDSNSSAVNSLFFLPPLHPERWF